MAAFPPMIVTFDDGTTVHLAPRPRDLLGAEEAGHNFTAGGNEIATSWAVAYATLRRLERTGALPEGVAVPASYQEFRDTADVDEDEAATDEDPEGKG